MYITTFLLIKANCIWLHVCVWLDTDILLSLSPSLSLFLSLSLSLSHNILYNWRFLPTPPNVSFLHLPCTSIIISFPVTHLSLSLSLPLLLLQNLPHLHLTFIYSISSSIISDEYPHSCRQYFSPISSSLFFFL